MFHFPLNAFTQPEQPVLRRGHKLVELQFNVALSLIEIFSSKFFYLLNSSQVQSMLLLDTVYLFTDFSLFHLSSPVPSTGSTSQHDPFVVTCR